LDTLLKGLGITLEPVSLEQSSIARDAYRNFGKSSGHPARLNFGDCFAYALAKEKNLVAPSVLFLSALAGLRCFFIVIQGLRASRLPLATFSPRLRRATLWLSCPRTRRAATEW
jgi:hypothetical protein